MRAIVVDDEVSARSRLKRQLAACPQIVVEGEADNGIAALDQIVALKPDVVFLDIQMPGMTGFEVLRNLPPERRAFLASQRKPRASARGLVVADQRDGLRGHVPIAASSSFISATVRSIMLRAKSSIGSPAMR